MIVDIVLDITNPPVNWSLTPVDVIFLSFSRDGRLREGDQLLAIDGQPLDISHQQAIHILQSAQGPVEIVVARGPVPKAPGSGSAQSPTSPTSSGGTFESQLPAGEQVVDPVVETPVEEGGLGQGDKSDMVVSTPSITKAAKPLCNSHPPPRLAFMPGTWILQCTQQMQRSIQMPGLLLGYNRN